MDTCTRRPLLVRKTASEHELFHLGQGLKFASARPLIRQTCFPAVCVLLTSDQSRFHDYWQQRTKQQNKYNKKIINLKMNICWKWTHTQAIQDEFVLFMGRGLETVCITLVAQWILCTEWVPSEWESKQLIKTSQQSTWHGPPINILWSEEKIVFFKHKIQIYL